MCQVALAMAALWWISNERTKDANLTVQTIVADVCYIWGIF